MSPIIEDTKMEYAEANKDVTLHVLNRIALALYPRHKRQKKDKTKGAMKNQLHLLNVRIGRDL